MNNVKQIVVLIVCFFVGHKIKYTQPSIYDAYGEEYYCGRCETKEVNLNAVVNGYQDTLPARVSIAWCITKGWFESLWLR